MTKKKKKKCSALTKVLNRAKRLCRCDETKCVKQIIRNACSGKVKAKTKEKFENKFNRGFAMQCRSPPGKGKGKGKGKGGSSRD
jgi:hypothetical protein